MTSAFMMGPYAIIKEIFGPGVCTPPSIHLRGTLLFPLARERMTRGPLSNPSFGTGLQLGKKLLCLACCLGCVAMVLLMIPQIMGDLITVFLTGGDE